METDREQWEGEEYIIRYCRLREDLKPVEIYPADTLEPIRPDWVAITHAAIRSKRWPKGFERYNLYFFLDDGRELAYEQFDTLEIAVDQAKAIAGILPNEWRECRTSIESNDGLITWKNVHRGM